MKTNNVSKISDYSSDKERDLMWKKIIGIVNRITTLNSMMPKSIHRSNRHLASSVQELLDALMEYDYLREGEKWVTTI